MHLFVVEFSQDTAMIWNLNARRLVLVVLSVVLFQSAAGGADSVRKVIVGVKPAYPELARQMHVTGTVKIEVVIAANGSVKSLKPLGGHPVLIRSASEALRKWRYAPGPETTTVVEFQFRRE